MPYDLYPAVDENYNFPPEVRQALAKSTELRGVIVPMTTVERNNLVGADLWDGRIIYNSNTSKLEQYELETTSWGPASISDHGGLSGLADDDHPQYLLRQGQGGIAEIQRLLQRTDTRNITLAYTGDKVTSVTEKDGATTIKTTVLNYTGNSLTSVVETVGGKTITTTLTYDGSGLLSSTSRAVA